MKFSSVDLFSRVPKNQLSQVVGKLVEARIPGPIGRACVRSFAKYYNINLAEAEKPIAEYATIADLFTRRLKPGVRPIESQLVHPCDAVISQSGYADQGVLIQAKGLNYTVEALLADWDLAEKFRSGFFATYYLCPTDYHRVHSPVSGLVTRAISIPGTLWPVNEWSVHRVRNLFAINERIVTVVESPEYGSVAVVMVGATNVGKMTVSFDKTLVTNSPRYPAMISKRYEPCPKLSAGDELGIFHMGSTVILLFESGRVKLSPEKMRGAVRMGQAVPKERA